MNAQGWWHKAGFSNEGCFITGVALTVITWCIIALLTTRSELTFWELFCGVPFILILGIALLRRAGHLKM